MPSSLICVAICLGAYGLRGFVKIKSFTELPVIIGRYDKLVNENGRIFYSIQAIHLLKKAIFRVRFQGVDDRTQAEKMKGIFLYLQRSLLPKLKNDSYYHVDLIGCNVQIADEWLGKIVALYNFGAGNVVEVQLLKGEIKVMLPFHINAVAKIDEKAQTVIMHQEFVTPFLANSKGSG